MASKHAAYNTSSVYFTLCALTTQSLLPSPFLPLLPPPTPYFLLIIHFYLFLLCVILKAKMTS